jgi:hypothetical protein
VAEWDGMCKTWNGGGLVVAWLRVAVGKRARQVR